MRRALLDEMKSSISRKTDAKKFDAVMNELMEEKTILPVQVEGQKNYFTLPEYIDQTVRLPDRMLIISPFDNLIIWRKRLREIFGFDYTLECYLPPEKRTYGYFCLPVLYKDEFIGRIDVKADRKNEDCTIKQEFWSNNHPGTKSNPLYEEALHSFAAFNQCSSLSIPT